MGIELATRPCAMLGGRRAGIVVDEKTPALGRMLLRAAFSGGVSEVSEALRLGADVHFRSELEVTALMIAAWRPGNLESLMLIADAGAEIDAVNVRGESALIGAVKERCFDNAKELLRRGASKYLRDEDGMTAGYIAKISGWDFFERA